MYTVYALLRNLKCKSWRRLASFMFRSDAIVFALNYRGPGLVKLVDESRTVLYNEQTRRMSVEFRAFLIGNADYLREHCRVSDEYRQAILTEFRIIKE